MNLAELFAAANAPATIIAADGTEARFGPDMVARLWTAVAEDRARMGLRDLEIPGLAVGVENGTPAVWDEDDGDAVVVTVGRGLRYRYTTLDGVTRLCEQRGCHGTRIGTGAYTAVCLDHLNTLISSVLGGLAGDDIDAAAVENLRADSRGMRLAAWGEELREEQVSVQWRVRRLHAERGE